MPQQEIQRIQVIDSHSPLHVERPWTHEHGADRERATQPYPESTPYWSSFPPAAVARCHDANDSEFPRR